MPNKMRSPAWHYRCESMTILCVIWENAIRSYYRLNDRKSRRKKNGQHLNTSIVNDIAVSDSVKSDRAKNIHARRLKQNSQNRFVQNHFDHLFLLFHSLRLPAVSVFIRLVNANQLNFLREKKTVVALHRILNWFEFLIITSPGERWSKDKWKRWI